MTNPANIVVAYPIQSDADTVFSPVLSGGLWDSAFPLSNLQTPYLVNVAQTLQGDCTTQSSQFQCDLGTSRIIQVVAIAAHNLTTNATYEIDIATDSGFTDIVATSGAAQPVYPQVFNWGALPFEHESWWNGKLTPETAQYFPQPILLVLSTPVFAEFVQVLISDVANPQGFIQLQRLIVAPGYQPSINVEPSSQISGEDATIVGTTLSGVDFYDTRPRRRQFVGSIPYLPKNEALMNIFDTHIRAGISGQLYFIQNPADTPNLYRTSFLGTFSTLDPLNNAAPGYMGAAYEILEVVA